MRILRRPMFSKGGSTNSGIMDGLERKGYAHGSGWENTTPSEWENIADSYGQIGSIDYTNPENIEKWSEPGTDFDLFKWAVKDKVEERAEKIEQEEIRALQNINAAELEGIKTISEVEKPETRGNELEKIIAKNESLSDRNKRYMGMMSPHMQKRMVADALGAASEAFGKGTGNTGQTIANAISAAAAGMGGSKDIYDKVKMLTLQGEIMKDVEAAKPKKLNATETLIALGMSKDPDKKALFTKLSKSGDTTMEMAMEFSKGYQTKKAEKGLGDAYQLKASSANAKNYGGTLPLTTDGEEDFEKMVKGEIYYNYLDLNFYSIGDDGKPTQVAKPDYLK